MKLTGVLTIQPAIAAPLTEPGAGLTRPASGPDRCGVSWNGAMDSRPCIFDLDHRQLSRLMIDWGLPAFRADQVLRWIYRHHTADPSRMTNIPSAHQRILAEHLRFADGQVRCHQTATDGVQKLLIRWSRAHTTIRPMTHTRTLETECVMIPANGNKKSGHRPETRRRTACVSSQIGCPVGCLFCASGLGGLDGNHTSGHMVEQVWRLAALPGVTGITHVVFMGMGEPLANLEQVTRAIGVMTADWGLGISARHITVSTVGLPSQMRRLADLKLPVTLAISLHAPNDHLRRRLIPWAQHVSIDQLTDAGRYYFERTGREVTLEYILLGGVNDQAQHASELTRVARTLRANVNLIRYNEVKSLPYVRPNTQSVYRFQNILRSAAINTHIRASRGRDIAAACGQLRHEHTVQQSATDRSNYQETDVAIRS